MTQGPATDRFKAEIRKSHTIVTYVDVISPDGDGATLPVVDGDIKADRTAAVRRSITITCIDPDGDLVPSGVNSLLTPFGAELFAYRGVIYDDGTEEIYPLGVFRISQVSVADTTGGSPEISIEGFDRSRTVSRDMFTVPYTIAQGTNVVDAIKSIIQRTYPTPKYDTITTNITTSSPKVYDAGNNPWDAVSELAQSIGCEIFFDVDGDLVIRPPHDVDALPTPDFTYIEGEGNTMTDISQVYVDEPGFNGVIVTGESAGDELPPVRGEAWDDDPNSITYRFGPYGEVPMFVQDTILYLQSDAEQAAKSLLSGQLGFSSQLDVSATVNPTYECGDVVKVVRTRSHIDALYIVDAFNVPLRKEGIQSLTLRQKRKGVDIPYPTPAPRPDTTLPEEEIPPEEEPTVPEEDQEEERKKRTWDRRRRQRREHDWRERHHRHDDSST